MRRNFKRLNESSFKKPLHENPKWLFMELQNPNHFNCQIALFQPLGTETFQYNDFELFNITRKHDIYNRIRTTHVNA